MRRILPTLLLTSAMVASLALPAAAAPRGYENWHTPAYWKNLTESQDAIEWEMVDEINMARTRRGLQPLRVQADIRTVARAWSQTMSASDSQYHNPNYTRQITQHSRVAENIWGHLLGGVHVMHEGFMDSPGHRANLLRPVFDEVGVGTVFNPATGKWWTTVNFRQRRPGTSPQPEPARPPNRPADRAYGVVPITGRIAGGDRVATAVAVSHDTFTSAGTVVLARADEFADALSGGPLAAAVDGPLLLTDRGNLDTRVLDEIRRLGADRAYLLGGTTALSPKVERALTRADIDVVRLSGPDRFATSAQIATEVVDVSEADHTRVYVADGTRGWPDALSASARAGAEGAPLLLVGGGTVPTPAADMLRTVSDAMPWGGAPVIIVGGTTVVTDAQANKLAAAAGNDTAPQRIAGGDRYGTSAAVANLTPNPTSSSWNSNDTTFDVWAATGRNWPDALAAAAAAAHVGAKFLLIDGHDPLNSRMSTLGLADHLHRIKTVTLIGGPGVITPAAADSLQARLR